MKVSFREELVLWKLDAFSERVKNITMREKQTSVVLSSSTLHLFFWRYLSSSEQKQTITAGAEYKLLYKPQSQQQAGLTLDRRE